MLDGYKGKMNVSRAPTLSLRAACMLAPLPVSALLLASRAGSDPARVPPSRLTAPVPGKMAWNDLLSENPDATRRGVLKAVCSAGPSSTWTSAAATPTR